MKKNRTADKWKSAIRIKSGVLLLACLIELILHKRPFIEHNTPSMWFVIGATYSLCLSLLVYLILRLRAALR